MAQKKYYVVWVGKRPGIYTEWSACKGQVDGYIGAKYKSFLSREEAEQAYQASWKKFWGGKGNGQSSRPVRSSRAQQTIDLNSISVDVGTKGNPGPIEYRGVNTQTGEVLFSCGPIPNGTNNIGEFLAIVHSLAYLKREGSTKTVYSDSRTALKWVREKRVATTLVRNETTQEVWKQVDKALHWLQTNPYDNKLLKWDTEAWGEIKADYGRK